MAQENDEHPLRFPHSPRRDVVETMRGMQVHDPYRWLEDVETDETQRWIAAENELTFDFLNQIPARQKIQQRMNDLCS